MSNEYVAPIYRAISECQAAQSALLQAALWSPRWVVVTCHNMRLYGPFWSPGEAQSWIDQQGYELQGGEIVELRRSVRDENRMAVERARNQCSDSRYHTKGKT